MDPQVKEQLEIIARTTETFRNSYDERLKEVEKRGHASGDTVTNSERANEAITALETKLEKTQEQLRELETAQARLQPLTNGDAREKLHADATAFLRAARHIDPDAEFSASNEDVAAYSAYTKTFAKYARFGKERLSGEMQNSLRTGSDPDGGFWLTPDVQTRIIKYLEDLSPLRQNADVIVTGRNEIEGPYDIGEASAYWTSETASRTTETDNPRIDGKWKIVLGELAAEPRTTQRMLDDVDFDLEGWMAKAIAKAFSKKEEDAFINGDGVEKPRGILTYAAGTPANTSVANYRVLQQYATTQSGAFKTATTSVSPGDVLIDMIEDMPNDLIAGSKFYMNKLTKAAARKLKDAEGAYLLNRDFSQGGASTLLGQEVVIMSGLPNMSSNSLSLLFANMKEGYSVVDHRVGTRTLRDALTLKGFVKFYTTKRVGGDVMNFQAIKILKFGT